MKRRESIPGLGKITMSNQNLFVRQTITVLMTCGLIVSLLPGVAAAQDWSTLESRKAWMIGQNEGVGMVSNGKFAAAIALARLELNPNDAEVIDRITHYYDRVPAGKNGEQFAYPGVAWVLVQHWDKFTPTQRDHLKAKLNDFNDLLGHGTENHAIMKCVAAYLFAQYWPNEDGWVRGQYSSEQVAQASRARILQIVSGYYHKNHEEYLCPGYMSISWFPYYALYDCAKDPEIKNAAYAALCYFSASLAANNFRGLVIPPYARAGMQNNDGPDAGGFGGGTTFLHWLYAGPEQTHIVPVASKLVHRWDPAAICAYASVSSFVPPPAIISLWRGETAPYMLTSSASAFGHHGTTPGFWGTGEPGAKTRYIYRHPDYAVGSGFMEYYPDELFKAEESSLSIIYKSRDKHNTVQMHHHYWHSDEIGYSWGAGANSPFVQIAQHKSAAISLFNIPTADPWAGRGRDNWCRQRDGHYNNLIQEAMVRYPKSIDQKTEANGWIFLREGDVYIAIRPLKAYTIDPKNPGAGEFDVVVSAFAQSGFVFDVATKREFATFEAFQAAVAKNPPLVDWSRLSATYTSLGGDTITATWNPPDYAGPPKTKWRWVMDNSALEPFLVWSDKQPGGGKEWSWDAENRRWNGPAGDPWYPGSRVRVRPDITVNGAVVPIDTTYPPLKSPSATIAEGTMRLSTPAGEFELDWRGNVPKFSNQ